MARYQALIFHGEKSSVRKREKKLLREKYQVFVQNPNSNKKQKRQKKQKKKKMEIMLEIKKLKALEEDFSEEKNKIRN